MMIQTKFQIKQEDYEFIKKVYKDLHYKSLSEYIREAVKAKAKEDRKKLREIKRMKAMEMIGKTSYENLDRKLNSITIIFINNLINLIS